MPISRLVIQPVRTACGTADGAEPAWQSRQRRKRADARVLIRLSGARSTLASHHSAQGGSSACAMAAAGKPKGVPPNLTQTPPHM